MKIQHNTIYCFNMTNRVQFGDLPDATLYKVFQDGRIISKFLEHYIPIWFPEVKFVDARGHDHVDTATGKLKWDLKGFTIKSGARYLPSKMIGGGRKKNLTELHAHANTIDYIFSDVTEFPIIRIQFKTGTELVTQFPSGEIKLKERDQLFDGSVIINETLDQ